MALGARFVIGKKIGGCFTYPVTRDTYPVSHVRAVVPSAINLHSPLSLPSSASAPTGSFEFDNLARVYAREI